MVIPTNFSSRINELIQDYVADVAPDPLNLRQLVARENVLPLLIDMSGVIAINPGGDIISFPFGTNAGGDIVAFPYEGTEEARVEVDPRIRNIALFQGSKKYPEMMELIVKPAHARACPSCGGTGVDPYAARLNIDGITCYCGGLGWIP